jgi:leucyl/phenylalanyl-tRNA--protein transferase
MQQLKYSPDHFRFLLFLRMPVAILNQQLVFPPVHEAEEDGLLAIGGDLSSERLLLAYKQGIFPWFDETIPICWYTPDPRFILLPENFKINKTVKSLLKKNAFDFTVNNAFTDVIRHCKQVVRDGQDGTWITDEVELAYIKMHELGYAHSAEVWMNGKLVGGLYGIRLGKVFFGESMFSLISNASRYAFAKYMEILTQEGTKLIDCQIYTPYVESMGASMIPRADFQVLLAQLVS